MAGASPEAVSVVIPVHDGERYLAEAIESALGQTLPPAEVIVVDDGSSDGSAELASRFPVRVLRTPHRGSGPARNHGVSASTGSLLAFLDADDLWVPRKLELQVETLGDQAVDAVAGHLEEFVSRDADPTGLRPPHPPMPSTLPSVILVRRSSFRRVGPLADRWAQGEWIDWWSRAHDAGLRWTDVPEVLVRRRLHERNHSRLRAGAPSDFAEILKESLERRREQERRS